MKWYLFAKFFTEMTQDQLMEYCVQEGIDGPTALVRDGYWTAPDKLAETLPGFVACAKKHGLEVKYADTHIDFADMYKAEKDYDTLAANGIELIRLQYIERNGDKNPREFADVGRRFAETACKMGEKHGVRSVIQLHGGFYPHNATCAWGCVKDLDPRYIGIKIDPGNNFAQEGYEHFTYQIRLLGEYIAALGSKDACALRVWDGLDETKGWQKPFMPAFAGQANYKQIFGLLKEINFQGPAVLMPFYHEDNLQRLKKDFTKEIQYLKACAQVE